MKKIGKSLSLLIAILLVVMLIPISALAENVEIQSGTGSITPNYGHGINDGTIIGFAGQEWWVIGNETIGVRPLANHATLLVKSHGSPYGSVGTAVSYQTSQLYSAMTDIYNNIASKEQALITAQTIDSIWDGSGSFSDTHVLNGQYVWPLSGAEWESIADETVRSYGNSWWLRSSVAASFVHSASNDGYQRGLADPASEDGAVRPALNLNLASVLFTSAASGSKSKPGAVGTSLSAADSVTNTEIKFTMQDTSQTLSVAATAAQSTQSVSTNNSLAFSYSNATTGTNQYVSCILVDSLGEVAYYGKLTDNTSAASGTISIPLTGISDGIYTLRIFSEEANGDNYTDFASNPIDMTLTVGSGNGTVSNFSGTVLSGDTGNNNSNDDSDTPSSGGGDISNNNAGGSEYIPSSVSAISGHSVGAAAQPTSALRTMQLNGYSSIDNIVGNAVTVRISVPEGTESGLSFTAFIAGARVDTIANIFDKWFSNKIAVIHFDQSGDWGQAVNVAARIDLSGVDTKNLVFYAYNSATNTYKRIQAPAYWIDANGYLRFTTPYAGDVIMSEGTLVKR